MLPQDTCGLLPWRVTVPLMQVFGCFPYKLTNTSGPPVFSLPLFLWCIAVHLYLACMSSLTYVQVFQMYSAPDLGTVFFLYCVALMMVTVTISPVLLTMKSSKLAAFLHDISQIMGVSQGYKISPKNFGIMLTMVTFIVFSSWFSFYVLNSEVFEFVMIFLWSISWNLSIFMPESCFASLLDLMTRYLLLATESTVATVSKLLGPDGSFSGEDDAKEALLAMRNLESLIRKVRRVSRRGLASCSVQSARSHCQLCCKMMSICVDSSSTCCCSSPL